MAAIRTLVCAAAMTACVSPLDSERSELRERQRDWQRLGIGNYTFVYRRSCFCPPELIQPWRITVRNGQVFSVLSVAEGKPPESTGFTFPTIDEIFGQLEAFTEHRNAELEVRYDSRYHFPIDARGDIKNAQDAGFTIEVTEFQVTPT